TVRLEDALKKEYPGTGDYAALKVHKLFSVGIGTTIDFHLSPARDHDAKHFEVDEAFGGHGVLADLGYASLRLLRQCERHDVRFVIRLKENWKPKVLAVESGELSRELLDGAGEDLDALLTNEVLKLEGKDIDADVRVGGPAGVTCRLVAVL